MSIDPETIDVHQISELMSQEPPAATAPDEETAEASETAQEESEPSSEVTEDTPEAEAKTDESDDGGDIEFDPDAVLREMGFPDLPEDLQTPEIKRRIAEQQQGVMKLVDKHRQALTEIEQSKEAIESVVGKLQAYSDFVDALANKATARTAWLELGKQLEREHGITLTDDYYVESESETPAEDPSKSALDAFEKKYGSILSELAEDKQRQKQEAAIEQRVNEVAPKVIGFLAKMESGWGVTKDMVRQAAKEMPSLFEDDPVKAVKATFPDELANHKASVVAKKVEKKGPEMLDSQTSRGQVLPDGFKDKDPADLTAEEIWQLSQALNR